MPEKIKDQEPSIHASYFLPDLCERWNLFVVMVIAELLAIILTAAQAGDLLERLRFLALASLYIQWVALTDAGLLCLSKRWLQNLPLPLAAIIVFLLLQLVTVAFTFAAYGLQEYTAMILTLPANWLGEKLLSNLMISICVSAIVLRYFYVAHQWRQNVRMEARSRIAELQARIRPHFLFNSMNTIASLTRADPRKAEQAVEDLAEMFRATLAERDKLSLAEEIELARIYLRIESLRLGERLRLQWEIDLDPEQVVLPALTLQPLVENAVYHGIENLPQGGCVHIRARRVGDSVELTVSNPLPVETKSEIQNARPRGNQMALENIRQRLRLMFAREQVLHTHTTDDHFTVTLLLPLAGMSL